jgi:lipopolysaccharide/colanic/teichoic acid biosynthesis glycosyltransferase
MLSNIRSWHRVRGPVQIAFSVVPLAIVLLPSGLVARGVSLESEPSKGTNIAGYRIYHGKTSLSKTNTLPVGDTTTAAISDLVSGLTYHFAATAHTTSNLQNDLSNDVSANTSGPPTIVLTSPANNVTFSTPATINFAAGETANGHSVTSVQFYNGHDVIWEIIPVYPQWQRRRFRGVLGLTGLWQVSGLPGWRRALDLALIVALSPGLRILGAGVALAVVCGSRGPVLFRQRRVGHKGREFDCYKFRTMQVHAETRSHQEHLRQLIGSETPMTKLDVCNDPRLVPLGALLRASGLDELPQHINVARGEMSIVGPRPCIPYEYEMYQPWQHRRCEAVPGLTGLWQVGGKNHTTSNEMIQLPSSASARRIPRDQNNH